MTSLATVRTSYDHPPLLEEALAADPLQQLQRWLDDALAAKVPEPNAMMLATVTADLQPHARVVLLRGLDAKGLVFFTNYESDKGRQLDAKAQAALTFFWPELARQARIEGMAERVSAAESDAYFASRPRGHQLGAWASEQSRPIASREVLIAREQALEVRYAGKDVPRPPHWGGYRVAPTLIEFWQGQGNRLHDRFRYTREGEGFVRVRLSP